MLTVFITLIILEIVVGQSDICLWNSDSEQCYPNKQKLIYLLNNSSNPVAKFMRCEQASTQTECNDFNDTCTWREQQSNSGFFNGFCTIKLPQLIDTISPCIQQNCLQNLQKIQQNQLSGSVSNCSISSVKKSSINNSNQACQYIQKVFDCLNKNQGQCFSTYCNQDEFCFYQLQYFPHFRQIDVTFVTLLNVQLSVQNIRVGGHYFYKRLSLLNMNIIDELLGFKIGTLNKFEHCDSSDDCYASKNPPKQINLPRDLSQKQIIFNQPKNQQKNKNEDKEEDNDGGFTVKSGWGLIILAVAVPSLFSVFVCGTILIRRRTSQEHVINAQNAVEIQIPKNNLNVQQIMAQFHHFKFKPKQNVENTQNAQNIQNAENTQNVQNTQNATNAEHAQNIQNVGNVKNVENAQYECDVCAICFDEYCKGQKITLLRCGHMYHKNCIQKWVATKGELCTCPLCGTKLVEGQ